MPLRSIDLLTIAVLAMAQVVSVVEAAGAGTFFIEGRDGKVPFFLYLPGSLQSASAKSAGVLLLVPGFNGSGESMLDERWKRFADQNSLVLLAPTFTSTHPEELHQNRGYYYPEQGSGAQVEEALAEVRQRTGVRVDQILIFGFSAGAHFAHRFALWKPERVKAFAAYSAAWWSDPAPCLRTVPALIMCGEGDERYAATRTFMEKGLALHLPWIWRSYKNTGHQLTPAVRSMAEVFLGCHARADGPLVNDYAGDIQTYRFVPENQADRIPPAVRIGLPKELAEIWAKEE